jgi:NADH-quinone oxidoreductase subunit C
MTDAPVDEVAEEVVVEVERRHGAPVTRPQGQQVLHAEAAAHRALLEALWAEGFDVCIDVTAVDYLTHPGRTLPAEIHPERFELVVQLLCHDRGERVRVRTQVPETGTVLPSLTDLWAGADAAEREVYDMFGILFQGHPDLTRILMPEDWEGHPLRKDYGVGRIPVHFKDAPGAR